MAAQQCPEHHVLLLTLSPSLDAAAVGVFWYVCACKSLGLVIAFKPIAIWVAVELVDSSFVSLKDVLASDGMSCWC